MIPGHQLALTGCPPHIRRNLSNPMMAWAFGAVARRANITQEQDPMNGLSKRTKQLIGIGVIALAGAAIFLMIGSVF